MDIIIFFPKLYSDRAGSELLSQSQLPVSCENLVSKGAKQSHCDQKTREFGSEWWLSKEYCKTSDTKGKYTLLAKCRPRVPGNRKVFYVFNCYPKKIMEKSYLYLWGLKCLVEFIYRKLS